LAAAGVPLFEVFLTKDGDSQYKQHAVYLQRDGNGTADSIVGFSKDVLDFENMLGAASKDMKLELDILEENSDEGDEKQMDLEAMEEGMNKILNFLKDRMPDVKMKVFQVHVILAGFVKDKSICFLEVLRYLAWLLNMGVLYFSLLCSRQEAHG
jgi:hypothetical protein